MVRNGAKNFLMSLNMNLMQNSSHSMKKVLHVLPKVWLYNQLHIVAYANIWHFAECKSVFASMMLVHLLPDTQTAATLVKL